jgi:hypothetical protein
MQSRVSWFVMLGVVFLLLSGCGADLRPCLHTTMGCDMSQKDTPDTCSEFAGPTTGCHTPPQWVNRLLSGVSTNTP